MANRNPISTALMPAFMRGFHAVHDNPKIFNDTLAYELLPEEVKAGLKKHLSESAAQMAPEQASGCIDDEDAFHLAVRTVAGPMLARARFVEDRIEEAIEKGISQYVILGAGLDTFAYRRFDLAERLQVFELDLPAAQEIKQQRLAQLNLPKPHNLHFIQVDFMQQSLSSVLTGAEYNPGQLSFFSWMGVTQYLPLEAVWATLKDITSISVAGSEIVFDYYDKSA